MAPRRVAVRPGRGRADHRRRRAVSIGGRELSFGNAITLSGDGRVLAVGAYRDNSDSTGIDGDQVNENARLSGAVFVY